MEYTEAVALGLKRYNTGRPCKYGHMADRRTIGRTCVICMYNKRKAWQHNNRERENYHNREYKRRHNHGYNDAAKIRMRAYYRKRAGLPEATRPIPENCECCGRKLEQGLRTHLDHCHTTGVFRGWLCNRCNLGIGHLGDCIEGLQKAIKYLKRANR